MALEIKILDYGDVEVEFELSRSRTRLWPRSPRIGVRLSRPRRHLAGRGRHRLPLQSDHGDARDARAAVP